MNIDLPLLETQLTFLASLIDLFPKSEELEGILALLCAVKDLEIDKNIKAAEMQKRLSQ